jgi:hypothetical protein
MRRRRASATTISVPEADVAPMLWLSPLFGGVLIHPTQPARMLHCSGRLAKPVPAGSTCPPQGTGHERCIVGVGTWHGPVDIQPRTEPLAETLLDVALYYSRN